MVTERSDTFFFQGRRLPWTPEVTPGGSPAPTREYVDPYGAGESGRYLTHQWTSTPVSTRFPAATAVVSWNATTPVGTWLEIELRTQLADSSWTKWYVMGRWCSGVDYAAGDIHRTSVPGQDDAEASIDCDVYRARSGREFLAFQVRVNALSVAGNSWPSLSQLAVLVTESPSTKPPEVSEWGASDSIELDVPAFSQNAYRGLYPEYGGGGQVWCSPTCSTMVMSYWGPRYLPTDADLADIEVPASNPRVPFAAQRVWDFSYEGAGNWPFNAAYAHTYGLASVITRLPSLKAAERYLRSGIPLIISLGWKKAELPEAGYESPGHLMVLRGFTEVGDPIVNDPNADADEGVRRIYSRANFERAWQQSSRGIVYVYAPPDRFEPAEFFLTATA